MFIFLEGDLHNIMGMKILLISVLSLLLFSGCETATDVYYNVQNESAQTLLVTGNDIIHSIEIRDTLYSNTEKSIANWSKRGKETDYFEPVSIFGQSLLIRNILGDTLKKDVKLLSTWSASVEENGRTAVHQYVLQLTDSDF